MQGAVLIPETGTGQQLLHIGIEKEGTESTFKNCVPNSISLHNHVCVCVHKFLYYKFEKAKGKIIIKRLTLSNLVTNKLSSFVRIFPCNTAFTIARFWHRSLQI
jgi:hypothetical protein